MPACHAFQLPGGGVALVRSSGARRPPCSSCGSPADLLCDFPLPWRPDAPAAGRRTCDANVCARCRTVIGPNRDLCRAHVPLWDFKAGEPRGARELVTAGLYCSCGVAPFEAVLRRDVAERIAANWYRLHAGAGHEPERRELAGLRP